MTEPVSELEPSHDELSATEPSDVEEDYDDEDFIPHTKKRGPFSAASITSLLFGLLLLTGVFWGGVEVQKHNGNQAGNASAAAFANAAARQTGAASGARQAAGGAAGSGGTGRAGGATIGQVKLIDGTNVYVTDSSGNIVKVTTSPASKVTKTVAGAVSDLKPGDTVVVQGAKDAGGDVAATAITVGGSAATGFGGGAGGLGGGGGTQTPSN